MNRIFNRILLAGLLTVIVIPVTAQKYPERKHIRSGNREFSKGDFEGSEGAYRQALEADPESFEARFNLGNSYYKQGRFEEAAEIFSRLSRDTSRTEYQADCHYNTGNALFSQRKFKEALEEYKASLRINPRDMEAKYNYAYTKAMIEDEDGDGDGDNDDNQDQDDQDQDQDGGGGDGDGDSDPDQGNDDNQSPPDQGDNRQDQGGMSREEAEQLLQAIQNNEDRTREKVEEQNARVPARSPKNW